MAFWNWNFISKKKALDVLHSSAANFLLEWKQVASMFGVKQEANVNPLHKTLAKPVTAIVIGAGNRGNVYGSYATLHPEELYIVGVADPVALRRERFSNLHHIGSRNRFKSWEDVFKVKKFADAVIISTPDHMHTGPCLRAMEMGYDILLEKPIAPTEEECRLLLKKARETGRIIAVCHVLRYAPYFRNLKDVLASGAIGKIISIQHLEPIEHVHMSHSYVRGNWANSDKTGPIVLAKSCHDTDILRWLVDEPSSYIHCFGGLKWFKSTNAPEGSTERCTGGCKVEATCPYSAIQIYLRNHQRLYVFDLPKEKKKWDSTILTYLKTTDYGRCVYRMNNNQPDHLTVNIEFKSGITAAFSMEAFTSYQGRRTRIMGSLGDIEGDMETFTLTNFQTGKKTSWSLKTDPHGGGDHRLMKDWVQAVGQQNPDLLSSSLEVSIESHLMAFAAEKSRLQHTIEKVEIH